MRTAYSFCGLFRGFHGLDLFAICVLYFSAFFAVLLGNISKEILSSFLLTFFVVQNKFVTEVKFSKSFSLEFGALPSSLHYMCRSMQFCAVFFFCSAPGRVHILHPLFRRMPSFAFRVVFANKSPPQEKVTTLNYP